LKAVKVMHTVALRNESSVQSGPACPSLSSHEVRARLKIRHFWNFVSFVVEGLLLIYFIVN